MTTVQQIDITRFFNEVDAPQLSGSAMELGDNAGAITWGNSVKACSRHYLLNNKAKREAFRKFVRESGGWSTEEIEAWSHEELNALLLQWVAGDMREAGLDAQSGDAEWADYQERAEAGQCFSRLFRADGCIYFDICN